VRSMGVRAERHTGRSLRGVCVRRLRWATCHPTDGGIARCGDPPWAPGAPRAGRRYPAGHMGGRPHTHQVKRESQPRQDTSGPSAWPAARRFGQIAGLATHSSTASRESGRSMPGDSGRTLLNLMPMGHMGGRPLRRFRRMEGTANEIGGRAAGLHGAE
jgi:hypothetical protein